MAGEPDDRASHLGPPVHPAGLPALRRSAHPGVPRGGEMDPAGVGLFRSHHPDHSGLWRLCRRYTLWTCCSPLGRLGTNIFYLPRELFKILFL